MSPLAGLNHKFDYLLDRLPAGWEALAVETHVFTDNSSAEGKLSCAAYLVWKDREVQVK